MADTVMSNGILSPSPSISSTTTSDTRHLPQARAHPLKPGSQKEIALINYLDEKILQITRRYAKKFSNEATDREDSRGYMSFEEVTKDIHPVLDVVWISGTPNIQIPYLLTLAGLFCSYMTSFPFSESMFSVASKLDEAFTQLLSGFSAAHISTTEKVRIKSLIEETRVVAVDVAQKSGHNTSLSMDDSGEEDTDMGDEEGNLSSDVDNPDRTLLSIAKLYKHTLGILGDSLV